MGKVKNQNKVIDELKMFYGYPPYDDGGNIVRGDGYFVRDLLMRHGAESLEALEKRVDFARFHRAWEDAKRRFTSVR